MTAISYTNSMTDFYKKHDIGRISYSFLFNEKLSLLFLYQTQYSKSWLVRKKFTFS